MNTIMNKIIKLSLLLLALPLLMTSCLKDDNEVFGDSSSKRLQQALEETRTVLRSSEKGWVMVYLILVFVDFSLILSTKNKLENDVSNLVMEYKETGLCH